MKDLSHQAKYYILTVLLVGGLISIQRLTALKPDNVFLFSLVCGLAALTQVLKVEGATAKSSYNISWVFYGFAFVMWGPSETLLVIVSAHLVEWIWHRYPWYIQSFNIASYALTVFISFAASDFIRVNATSDRLSSLPAILLGIITFTLVNHLLVGGVIWLARGENFKQSGVFSALTLMIDSNLLALGGATALVWTLSPLAALLTLSPLYLIYSTLKVPALQQRTRQDPKTGLFNARYLNEALEKELARSNRFDRPLTLIMGDLDLLRSINNTYGHLAGDEILIRVAKILQSHFREYDIVARFGGEEFAILMPETKAEQAFHRTEAVRATIEAFNFEITTSVTPIKITMSFGVAERGESDQSTDDLIHNADMALYHAKMTGRNAVAVYSDEGLKKLFSPPTPRTPRPLDAPPSTPAEKGGPPDPVSAHDNLRMNSDGSLEPVNHKSSENLKTRPPWLINAFISVVTLTALGVFAFASQAGSRADWMGLILFATLTLSTEWLAIEIYVRETSISTSAAPFIAGAMLFGPLGVMVLSLVVAGVAALKHRSRLSRWVFNTSNHLISGLLCTAVVTYGGGVMSPLNPPLLLGLSVLAGGIVYLCTTVLVAMAIHLDKGEPFWQIWLERFRWLGPSYLGMGLLAFALMYGYLISGMYGVLTVIGPLFILRLSQVQYLRRTESNVSELREANERLVKNSSEISTLNEELLYTLAKLIDLRDPHVLGHSEQVAHYAAMIAQELSLPTERVEAIHKAGLLHDIGKLGVPEVILSKPGRLSEAELMVMRQHPIVGADILETCHSLHELIPYVRYHHERFDGTGYPEGLQGPKIPLEARVLALADAIEAMASDRPYRSALDPQAILNEIEANAGTQFDPEVVDAFTKVVKREGLSILVNTAHEPMTQTSDSLFESRGQMLPDPSPGQFQDDDLFTNTQEMRLNPSPSRDPGPHTRTGRSSGV